MPARVRDLDPIATHRDPAEPLRASTKYRASNLNLQEQLQATTFATIVVPRHPLSLLATLLSSSLLVLVVVVPYCLNERWLQSTALRGLLISLLVAAINVTASLVNSPIGIRGSRGWHWRFNLDLPVTIAIGVGSAFIPVNGSTLGCASIFLVSFFTGAIVVTIMHTGLHATQAHKALDEACGRPIIASLFFFFSIMVAYVELSRAANGSVAETFVGLLLPCGILFMEWQTLLIMKVLVKDKYCKPKADFIETLARFGEGQRAVRLAVEPLEPGAHGGEPSAIDAATTPTAAGSATNRIGVEPSEPLPPLLGHIEAPVGYIIGFMAIFIVNCPLLAMVLEVVYTPSSRSWAIGLSLSMAFTVLKQFGWLQHMMMRLFGLGGKAEWATMNAVKVAYLRAQLCGIYVSVSIMLSIGVLRAITFGHWRCSPSVAVRVRPNREV